MTLIDPGYGYSNQYSNQNRTISITPGDTAVLVNASTPYTASVYGVLNSGIIVSGSGCVGTLYLASGGTINPNGLTAGILYPLTIASASLSAGALYVIS
jgi:hypothetical protein